MRKSKERKKKQPKKRWKRKKRRGKRRGRGKGGRGGGGREKKEEEAEEAGKSPGIFGSLDQSSLIPRTKPWGTRRLKYGQRTNSLQSRWRGDKEEGEKSGEGGILVFKFKKFNCGQKHKICHLNHFWVYIQFSSVKYIYIVVQPISRTFSSCKSETSYQLNNSTSSPQPLPTTILLSTSVDLTSLGTSYRWNHAVFVTGLFHLALCPQVSCTVAYLVHCFITKKSHRYFQGKTVFEKIWISVEKLESLRKTFAQRHSGSYTIKFTTKLCEAWVLLLKCIFHHLNFSHTFV